MKKLISKIKIKFINWLFKGTLQVRDNYVILDPVRYFVTDHIDANHIWVEDITSNHMIVHNEVEVASDMIYLNEELTVLTESYNTTPLVHKIIEIEYDSSKI